MSSVDDDGARWSGKFDRMIIYFCSPYRAGFIATLCELLHIAMIVANAKIFRHGKMGATDLT